MTDRPEPVAERVLALLREKGQTLSTAESLTGGLIGDLLTSVPGASASYRGGLITYATALKSTLAGVAAETLAQHGAVSEATAVEMAYGTAVRCEADWGVAATGVAGPERQEGHPAGTVFIAAAHPADGNDLVWAEHLTLSGNRWQIRRATAGAALSLVERAAAALATR